MSSVMRLFSRWKRSETTYSELKTSEEAADGQIRDPVSQKFGPAYREPSLWALSVFLASLSLYQYYQSVNHGPMGTYETGWWSDFGMSALCTPLKKSKPFQSLPEPTSRLKLFNFAAHHQSMMMGLSSFPTQIQFNTLEIRLLQLTRLGTS